LREAIPLVAFAVRFQVELLGVPFQLLLLRLRQPVLLAAYVDHVNVVLVDLRLDLGLRLHGRPLGAFPRWGRGFRRALLLSRSPVLAKDQCRNLPPLRDFGVRWVRPEKLAHSVVLLRTPLSPPL
jgi:hypothetical protein